MNWTLEPSCWQQWGSLDAIPWLLGSQQHTQRPLTSSDGRPLASLQTGSSLKVTARMNTPKPGVSSLEVGVPKKEYAQVAKAKWKTWGGGWMDGPPGHRESQPAECISQGHGRPWWQPP